MVLSLLLVLVLNDINEQMEKKNLLTLMTCISKSGKLEEASS